MGYEFSKNIKEKMEKIESEENIVNKVVEINVNNIDNWEYRDRKKFELGNIEALAESIKTKGQAQPIIVVEQNEEFKSKNNNSIQFVVIAGYRRWLACKSLNVKIKAIIERLTFDQAVACLVAENEKENISEYSKGMFYFSVLQSKKITQNQLSKKLGLAPTTLKGYLSFSRVSDQIWGAVQDLSKVSARTSAEIAALSKKGHIYIDALISIADKIRNGCGAKTINKLVKNHIEDKKPSNVNDKNSIKIKSNNKTMMTLTGNKLIFDKWMIEHPIFKNIDKILLENVLPLFLNQRNDKN